VAGFLFAASYFREFDAGLFLAAVIGTALIIASACVLNNYYDRDIDSRMERTKSRPSASGAVPGRNIVLWSAVLGIVGLAILILWTNWLVVALGIIGFIVYVWLYGRWGKRQSVHGTLVGSISGAMPITAGYCAVSGQLDAGAILVFLAIFFWQMPEFYSISIYRRKEYAAAKVPVISVVRGVERTKQEIFIYTILFAIATLLLTPLGYTGWIYFGLMAILNIYWLRLAWQGFIAKDNDAWARKNFHFSLVILMAYSLLIAVGPLLP
jgi:protoheme IX farnesyltransferase